MNEVVFLIALVSCLILVLRRTNYSDQAIAHKTLAIKLPLS